MADIDLLERAIQRVKHQLKLTIDVGNDALRDSAVVTDFEVRVEELPDIVVQLEKLRGDKEKLLVAAQNSAALDREDEQHAEIQAMIYSIKSLDRTLHPPAVTAPDAESTRRPVECSASGVQVSQLKLAKLSIPSFNGDIDRWTGFADLFRALVHEQSCYTDTEKLQYLKLHLKDEPLRLVHNLRLTDASYSEAWRILKRRYDNPRLIIDHHIDRILDVKPINKPTHEALSSFLTEVQDNLSALRVLEVPVEHWDRLLLAILLRKLDAGTRRQWEADNVRISDPTVDSLLSHLEDAVQVHRCLRNNVVQTPRRTQTFFTAECDAAPSKSVECTVCRAEHLIYKCPAFNKYSVTERLTFVEQNKLCFNCLSSKHPSRKCRSSFRCRRCQARHHTLLHRDETKPPAETPENRFPVPPTAAKATTAAATSAYHLASEEPGMVMLGTMLVETTDIRGQRCVLRALLDCASQQNYITRSCAEKLSLPRQPRDLQVFGLGMTPVAHVSEEIMLRLGPVGKSAPEFNVPASVTERIGGITPQLPVDLQRLPHLRDLQLADPHCGQPDRIDLLLGSKLFAQLLLGGRVTGPPGTPAAIETGLGWVVIGEIAGTTCLHLCSLHTVVQNDMLADAMRKFWEIEEVQQSGPDPSTSADDVKCERIYVSTVSRDASGRYAVTLPFKQEPPVLGDSYTHALACYRSLRRRLRRDPATKEQYHEFLRDFLNQGHMQLVEHPQVNNEHYFIPHLHVLRPESSTTKLRVVFNASKKTSNGVSLNDTLLTGPPLQADIREVLLRFRTYRYAFIGDLKQMFRQITVRPEHRRYQQILWSFADSETPQVFELSTVTFGMSCSPFLAIRTLRQLAEDERQNYPHAADVLVRDTYVDDVITGHRSLQDAIQLRDQLVALCSRGGFQLRKFSSNDPRVLVDIENQPDYNFDPDAHVKVLGIHWTPTSDCFSYRVQVLTSDCTKRSMLSRIARIFDPLGWLTPIAMYTKRLLQLLWTLALDWDETPPQNVTGRWLQFQAQLPLLSAISMPRYAQHLELPTKKEVLALVGFCDASEAGYAAVLYSVPIPLNDGDRPTLLYAKGRVSPLKRISIPRLELCAAVLLAKLIRFVQKSLQLDSVQIYAFSDSTVALTWIRSMPHRWKTFVSNRVTQIQETIAPQFWYHVGTTDNPADVASRGVLPAELVRHPLWWTGPSWLSAPVSEWPLHRSEPTENAELEARSEETTLTLFAVSPADDEFIKRQSSLHRLLRVTAYCQRFASSCRRQPIPTSLAITVTEMNNALRSCIRIVQHIEFARELSALRARTTCSTAIRRLDPFLAESDLIRVGGRLRSANLNYSQQHPFLLPAKHHLTNLIIDHHHRILLHAGPQALQAALASKYWILAARQRIRSRVLKCLSCFRAKPPLLTPKMGDLPSPRVTQHKPFEVCGTDMAGPIHVVWRRSRGARPIKSYICLFICFSTKAVHLEMVTDLSTDAFLAALRRLTARRGRVAHIYSDCGRNFIGAQRVLTSDEALSALSERGIVWHFNPPAAPHFGGLWEAGVKSAKHHIARVVGEQLLTYEEMVTFLAEIEGQLNSRPLTPASADPNELLALTPGHFLVTEPINSLTEPCTTPPPPVPLLKRWTLISQLRRSFWTRWQREYLHTLQQRSRWLKPDRQIQIDSLVVVHDPQLPPSKWKLGRVSRVIPGADGVVRTVEIRTAAGTMLRPAVKLAPLPTE